MGGVGHFGNHVQSMLQAVIGGYGSSSYGGGWGGGGAGGGGGAIPAGYMAVSGGGGAAAAAEPSMSYDQMLALDDKVAKKGLDKDTIKSRTFEQTLTKDTVAKLSEAACVICLDDFRPRVNIRRLPCKYAVASIPGTLAYSLPFALPSLSWAVRPSGRPSLSHDD